MEDGGINHSCIGNLNKHKPIHSIHTKEKMIPVTTVVAESLELDHM